MITNITTPCGSVKLTSINVGISSGILIPAIVADDGQYVMQVSAASTGQYAQFIGWYYGPAGLVEDVADATHFGGSSSPVVGDTLFINSGGDRLLINGAGDYLLIQ